MDSNIKFPQNLISGFAIGSLYLDIQSKELIKKGLEREIKIKYDIARNGDVKHSEACIKKISEGLGYAPKVYIREGLEFTIDWFLKAENIYK